VFERFTERARRVVVLAQEEARMLNHNYIGTEHILLGLIQEGEGVAARALERFGISLEDLRSEIEEIVGQGQTPPFAHIPFTPRAKKALELSLREALELGQQYVGTEHLLLGLVRLGEGVAAQALISRGVSLGRIREEVIALLEGYVHEGPPAPAEVSHEEAVCPRCRTPLGRSATFRTLDVASGEGETRAITFVFCRRCGTALGTLA
jgi:ATP-dependent Clp protease ATP-binding subunit ClpC